MRTQFHQQLFIALCLISPISFAMTASDVFQQSQQIILEIEHLRKKLNITEVARVPTVQSHKIPLHVYIKSLEVLHKIRRIQEENHLALITVGDIPLQKITPDDVYHQTILILDGITKIQTAKNTGGSSTTASLISAKTPSNVYESLWRASFLLDALSRKIKPHDVFINVLKVQMEMETIANKLGIKLKQTITKTSDKTKPSQVNLQGYINLHKISALQMKLKMPHFRVPEYPEGKIKASDVYDTSGMILGELARIKIHMNISNRKISTVSKENAMPSDVLAQLLLLESNIDLIANAIN